MDLARSPARPHPRPPRPEREDYPFDRQPLAPPTELEGGPGVGGDRLRAAAEDHHPPVAAGGGVAHEVRDLDGVDPLVAAAEVAAELGGEFGPVRGAACALEDAGERLARMGEGLALVEGDVEQPLPAPAERQTDLRWQLWKMCATSWTTKSANGSSSSRYPGVT